MSIKSKFTEQQQDHIKSMVEKMISAKKIAAAMDLPLVNVTYWVTKFRKELGLYTPRVIIEEVETETEEESLFEKTGFTVEEYNQKIIDAKDAHIKDLKDIIEMLAAGHIKKITVGHISSTEISQ